jgi:hypothetical protein
MAENKLMWNNLNTLTGLLRSDSQGWCVVKARE